MITISPPVRKKDRVNMHRIIILLILLSLFLSGCSLMRARGVEKTLLNSIVLVGKISYPTSFKDAPVVIAAYSKEGGNRTIIHYTTLHELGPYELMVPEGGAHNIIAFVDNNKNLTYDRDEPVGEILNAEQVSPPGGGVSGGLDIVLILENVGKIDLPVGFELPPKKYKKFHSTCPGAIADLDDYVFSAEFGRKGLWDGLEFYNEIGGNVYFLEEYDPDKIPILFVHGAAGSPQDWRGFFYSIDRANYQPWFFYYPSGASLDSMSHLLLWKIQNLQRKYKFKELYITAHSMGGLIVRSFLVNYGDSFPAITRFISISTPWGGEELAELGVKYSPGVIPAWRDIQPESEFIKSIFSKKLSPNIDYYLFFGHKGSRNILRENNDKAVTIASQLDQRSQQDAKMIYGFNEDHVSILSSNQVISQYNALLADTDKPSDDPGKTSGNRLYVDFSFDSPENQPKPDSILFLEPLDEKGTVTWIYLVPEDSGQVLGPFPPGEYNAYLIAEAFKPEPVGIKVKIEEGNIPGIRFLMKPDGYIQGYVTQGEKTTQAGEEGVPDAGIEIQSITLKGEGVNRTLTPLHGEDRTHSDLYPEYYLRATDFSVHGYFFFFGLPAGDYELSIIAKGYKPYTVNHNVELGPYQNTVPVELQKDTEDKP